MNHIIKKIKLKLQDGPLEILMQEESLSIKIGEEERNLNLEELYQFTNHLDDLTELLYERKQEQDFIEYK